MMKRIVSSAGLALVAILANANAAPVYLQCTSLNKASNEVTNYSITLDENTQTATFTDSDFTQGQTYTVPAQFTQTDVKFSWVMPGLGFTFNFRIDRTNLQFIRNFMNNPAKTDFGTCKIAEAVKRQF
jgi:hypothetical protein